MKYFPPDEVITILQSNANFAITDCCNDLSDMAMFQLGGALEGAGENLHASSGGTTGISAVEIP